MKGNTDYRLVIETEVSGKKWYYVQKRFMWYFWRYLHQESGFSSTQEAEVHIQSDINNSYSQEQKRIIKREYVVR